VVIEPLATGHDRAGFDCGVESLNSYLKRYARQNADRDLGVTFVAVAEPGGSGPVLGYYTLATGSVARDTVPPNAGSLPRYPVPTALLGQLAVDKSEHGAGLGKRLLLDALRRAQNAAEQMGIYAVEVVAKDQAARAFYERYGFQPLLDDTLHLYLPMKTLRKLGL